MHSDEIRSKFLEYFKSKDHPIIESSSVVPHSDPTLLFNNAGMNQFKDIFLGAEAPEHPRAATCQKCIRVGGKHNDLENVGHTSRHLTFFEMLGNFSFGDYFKKEAIQMAFEVSTEVFGFDKEKIYPTVHENDEEAFELWTQYFPAEKITKMGDKDNFWAMGDVGPCGPCSELFLDRGAHRSSAKNPAEDPEGIRFIEFWNLVFMQMNRKNAETVFPLPKPSIDTGAGLERIAALKLDVESLFETDILRSLISFVEKISHKPYDPTSSLAPAYHVIADHIRSLCFAIADGSTPSNVDRGYVLRKLVRRAVRYGKSLDIQKPFLTGLIDPLTQLMGSHYKELVIAKTRIADLIASEEDLFHQTLKRGGGLLQKVLAKSQEKKRIDGADAFKLKDTYGFPIEEISLIAKDLGYTIDHEHYKILEERAKQLSKKAHKKTEQIALEFDFDQWVQTQGTTSFVGYENDETKARILKIFHEGKEVDKLEENQTGSILVDHTVCYAEMGGQIGDQGEITGQEGSFVIEDTTSPFKGIVLHQGKIDKGTLQVGADVEVRVDTALRRKVETYHSATHILHWALAEVLGPHIQQKGSLVAGDRLRFDFSHDKALSSEQIDAIENLINEKIFANIEIHPYETSFNSVKNDSSIKQFFGEKYGAEVRVVDMKFCKELCGGTHTKRTGNIGIFKIAKESAIAAGVRRIEAVCGFDAMALIHLDARILEKSAQELNCPKDHLLDKIQSLIEEKKELSSMIEKQQKQQRQQLVESLLKAASGTNEIQLVIHEVDVDSKELRQLAQELFQKIPSGVVVLGSKKEDSCQILVQLTQNLKDKGLHAKELLQSGLSHIEGRGGGKELMAQAGGSNPLGLQKALEAIEQLIKEKC